MNHGATRYTVSVRIRRSDREVQANEKCEGKKEPHYGFYKQKRCHFEPAKLDPREVDTPLRRQ